MVVAFVRWVLWNSYSCRFYSSFFFIYIIINVWYPCVPLNAVKKYLAWLHFTSLRFTWKTFQWSLSHVIYRDYKWFGATLFPVADRALQLSGNSECFINSCEGHFGLFGSLLNSLTEWNHVNKLRALRPMTRSVTRNSHSVYRLTTLQLARLSSYHWAIETLNFTGTAAVHIKSHSHRRIDKA